MVAGLARALARGSVLLFRQNLGIRRPEVCVQQAALVRGGNALPEQAAGGFATVADGVSDDLARSAALGQSHPALVLAETHERPPSG